MTATHLYLSLIPQALIASMLEPMAFGRYYAVGTRAHSRGEAIFFAVDPACLPPGEFPLDLVPERCVAKADGSPRSRSTCRSTGCCPGYRWPRWAGFTW